MKGEVIEIDKVPRTIQTDIMGEKKGVDKGRNKVKKVIKNPI